MRRATSFLLALLMLVSVLPAHAQGNPYDLPISLTPGYEANPACFIEDGYEDDSLSVRMEKRRLKDLTVDIAWIKVKSPTQLRTAIAGTPNSMQEDKPGTLVRAANAVVAINGDMYSRRKGMLYRMGVALKQTESPEKDSLFIDENGDFHVFINSDPKEMVEYLKAGHQMINTFSFGPAMVVDGQVQTIREDYWFECLTRAPRVVIGQIDTLSYVFVEAEGRNKESRGFTMQQMADFMGTLGVKTAYNLDGGNSATMFFNRTYYDWHYTDAERRASDIIYVCSAVDPATWKEQ